MQNAAKILVLYIGAAALTGCGSKQAQNQAGSQDMSVEANLAQGQLPPNAEIETLPPDESSGTSSGELNAGDDNPDVNELSNAH
jgi:hypothetical protein